MSSEPGTTQTTISWIVSEIMYTPENYTIMYGSNSESVNERSQVIEGTTDITTAMAYLATIANLEPFTLYYYKVVAQNSFDSTESITQTFQTLEAGNGWLSLYCTCIYICVFILMAVLCCIVIFVAPTAPPSSFTTTYIGPRNVTLSWNPPQEGDRNGIIMSYTITCSDFDDVQVGASTTISLTTTLADLAPYSFYSCSITAATTGGGEGPASVLNFTTAVDGKLHVLLILSLCTQTFVFTNSSN